MEITIVLRDTDDGQVQVEETRHPGYEEEHGAITTATILSDEMMSLLDKLGES